MTKLDERLERLPRRLCLAYGAGCVERAVPIFGAFIVAAAPRLAVEKVWRWACGEAVTRRTLRASLRAVRQVTPDLDELGTVYAPAMFVAVGVMHLLDAVDVLPGENVARAIKNVLDAVAGLADYDLPAVSAEQRWQQRALRWVESRRNQSVRRAMFDCLNTSRPSWADRIPEA